MMLIVSERMRTHYNPTQHLNIEVFMVKCFSSPY